MQWVICTVCLRTVHVFMCLSLTQDGEGVSGGSTDVLCLLLIGSCFPQPETVTTQTFAEGLSFPRLSRMRWSILLHFASLPPPIPIIFELSVFAWNTKLSFTRTSMTGIFRQSSAFIYLDPYWWIVTAVPVLKHNFEFIEWTKRREERDK